jgi:hypothetical protein
MYAYLRENIKYVYVFMLSSDWHFQHTEATYKYICTFKCLDFVSYICTRTHAEEHDLSMYVCMYELVFCFIHMYAHTCRGACSSAIKIRRETPCQKYLRFVSLREVMCYMHERIFFGGRRKHSHGAPEICRCVCVSLSLSLICTCSHAYMHTCIHNSGGLASSCSSLLSDRSLSLLSDRSLSNEEHELSMH